MHGLNARTETQSLITSKKDDLVKNINYIEKDTGATKHLEGKLTCQASKHLCSRFRRLSTGTKQKKSQVCIDGHCAQS